MKKLFLRRLTAVSNFRVVSGSNRLPEGLTESDLHTICSLALNEGIANEREIVFERRGIRVVLFPFRQHPGAGDGMIIERASDERSSLIDGLELALTESRLHVLVRGGVTLEQIRNLT